MNIKIQSPSGYQLPQYDVTLITAPQPFHHTNIEFQGSFGRILIIKMDLQHCTVWSVLCQLNESVSLLGLADKEVYQIFLPVPASFENLDLSAVKVNSPELQFHSYLSIRNNQTIDLPATSTRLLCIHYTPEYFQASGNGSYKELLSMFQSGADGPGNPVRLNAAILTILRQIIFASPANKLLHLYLQAKVAETLSLLWHLINPALAADTLTSKELEQLQKAKDMITANLANTYTSYELSKLIGTNAYTLKKNFRTWFGIPLKHYLYICRMEKATELLIHTTMTIKEIAFAVGYKNVSNFSESFKSYYGYSPTRLRESPGF